MNVAVLTSRTSSSICSFGKTLQHLSDNRWSRFGIQSALEKYSEKNKINNKKMMSLTVRKIAVFLVIAMILAADCDAKRKKSKKFATKAEAKRVKEDKYAKQLELRETSPPNFVRLLIMRLIYGIAAQMNLEERVSGWFNGAFVPPNADYDDYGFGGGLENIGGLEDIGGGGIGDLFE